MIKINGLKIFNDTLEVQGDKIIMKGQDIAKKVYCVVWDNLGFIDPEIVRLFNPIEIREVL